MNSKQTKTAQNAISGKLNEICSTFLHIITEFCNGHCYTFISTYGRYLWYCLFIYFSILNIYSLSWINICNSFIGIILPLLKLMYNFQNVLKYTEKDHDHDISAYTKYELLNKQLNPLLCSIILLVNNLLIMICCGFILPFGRTFYIRVVQLIYFLMNISYFKVSDLIYRFKYNDKMLILNQANLNKLTMKSFNLFNICSKYLNDDLSNTNPTVSTLLKNK